MRISALAVALPKQKVTNPDVINMIRERSHLNFEGDLEKTLRLIEHTLGKVVGTNERYWLADGETSLSVTLKACRDATSQLGDDRKVDLVIVASVYGELAEPATANLIAHELGYDDAEAFDMKEACDGWVKAMKVANALICAGTYRRVLVVNCEFSMRENYAGLPELFRLRKFEELQWRLPVYTIGEGATATIVERDDESAWAFTNKTRNDLFDLCTVAPPWFDPLESPSPRVGVDGPGHFTSWASQLTEHGFPLMLETYRESGIDAGTVDIMFTHASSSRDWWNVAKELKLTERYFDIHGRTGNLVSASIPAAMALAVEDGKLERGQEVLVLCASAGMTFSTVRFKF